MRPAAGDPARIGPNAITRVAEVFEARFGPTDTDALFAAAGLGHHRARPPTAMVAEADVIALHGALRERLGLDGACALSREAGLRTGDYLLAHRIPPLARRLLPPLPAPLAAPILLRAMAAHAWTFAGSGAFGFGRGHPLMLTLADSPLCRSLSAERPVCDFFAGTFERLFRALVHPDARVVETECGAMGADACVFTVTWRAR